MGNRSCCIYRNDNELFSKKLMKIYIKKEEKKILQNIVFYDIETMKIEKNLISNLVTSAKGFGELLYMDCLFLCGGNESFIGSTYFLKYSFLKGLCPLVNCIYSHKYPTLVGINMNIYCIGGLEENVNCERYLLLENRWESICSLPESRSGCSPFYDEVNNYLYLFGGYNYVKSTIIDSIIRIKITNKSSGNPWEVFSLNSLNGSLLKKTMMGVITLKNSCFLLLGGFSYNEASFSENETGSVIKVDLQKRTLTEEKYRLKTPSSFNSKSSIQFNNESYSFLIDDKYNIHKFDHDYQEFSIKKILDN